jgi:hypothetical protein
MSLAAYTDDGRALVVVDEFVASRVHGKWLRRNLFSSAEWRAHFKAADAEQALRLAAEAQDALRDPASRLAEAAVNLAG